MKLEFTEKSEKLERMQKNLRKANRSAYQRKKEAGMVRINFWIPGELKERFDRIAANEPNSKEDLMTQAIEEFCDKNGTRSDFYKCPCRGADENCPDCGGDGWI